MVVLDQTQSSELEDKLPLKLNIEGAKLTHR